MKRALLMGCFMLLAACANRPPLPVSPPVLELPVQLHVERQQGKERLDWLLVMQSEDGALRWSLVDPLGIPQARQRLVGGQWQADGFLPPNPQARELFAALLFALTPSDELARAYPTASGDASQRRLGHRWQVRYEGAGRFTVDLQDDLHYRLAPLQVEAAP